MNQTRAEEATAVILAGGKSSRMGRPKALLRFAGEPLIVHMVRRLGRLFSDTVVVAAADQELPALPSTIVRDDVAYQGPVGGIYYGLKAARREICFVTSCDAPFLNLRLIAHLMAQISDYDVVVPFTQERFQPLHAVYRKQVAPLLKEQLERGELRPIFLYDKVRTRKITEAEMHPFDPENLSFLNMNTPEDYQAALASWNERQIFEIETGQDRRRIEIETGRGGQGLETETAPPSVSDSDSVSTSVSVSNSIAVTVELFGVARLLAKTTEVSLSLPQEATLSHVCAALATEHPVLLGRVINRDRSSLSSGYACNINGLEFVKNPNAKVNPGDKIFILSADAGG
ncbi:MAG TPA: NTP transferase domain-containing protein [Candidatus Deferrimicrobium sp.]|nr:NTP transferase domain-containing protein [Candidatus Deferrimicrobium sp.]